MARVEADAEPRVTVEPFDERLRARRASGRSSPPVPAEFSISSHVSRLAALEDLRERGHRPLEAGLEAGAEMRADVEDDAVRLDRARGVDGVAHRLDRLLVDPVVRRREVAEVERVADDAADPGLGRGAP